VDKEFGRTIIQVIDTNYFDNKYFKLIVQMIKEYYKKYEHVPTYETIEQISKSEIQQELALKIILDTLAKIKSAPIDGSLFVQEKALKFCKQQELQKAITKAQKVIDGGEFENYDQLEELVREALQVGTRDDLMLDVFSNLDEVLNEDFRHPIPIGVPGIDRLLKGGLAKGEIGVILAPTGAGKSTFLTKIANHSFNLGYNVLQIFFEDNPKIIQRKHFTLWTKTHPDEMSFKKEEVISKVREIEEKMTNRLILEKLPSDTMTMSQIKNLIRKKIADGIKIDMVLLDYVDCVVPEKNLGDEWKSEGSVMRAFEAMCHEMNLVGWTATQGNRCVSLDTIVNIENKGLIKIKDVVLGDKILTHKGYKPITYIFPIEKQPVYKIKTKSGKEIKVSSKHKFPVKGNGLLSIQSGLNVGDRLFIK
jgi:replicative DNA helicase